MIRVDSRPFAAAVAFAVLAACASPSTREARIDPRIAGEIAKIKAVDNHAHPVRPTAQGEKPDDEYDALPVDNLEPQSDPVRQRPKARLVVDAGKQLYDGDRSAALKAHAADYATWMLDKMGIETMLAN